MEILGIRNAILLLGLLASFHCYSTIPSYTGTYNNTFCFSNDEQFNAIKREVEKKGNITDIKTKQLTERPELGGQINSLPNLLMLPFPEEISNRVAKDGMYAQHEGMRNIACVQMFEIDYHKIAYHLVYRRNNEKMKYQDIGTVIIADNQKKKDFELCKGGAKAIIEGNEKAGVYRKSYQVGIGIPFGFNSISKYNRDKLNNVPPEAVQCQMKALPRENADHEYILYYTWKIIEKGGIFKNDEELIRVRIIDKR